jgi:two-component system chemotaxis response regulator CheB
MQGTTTVVAMGASLGGLVACRRVLWALPKQFPAAVLIAQHRHADGESLLAGLLNNKDGLPVFEPDDKAPIVAGRVYVAPGNYHLMLERGAQSIALSTDPPVRFARPSIDVLFESVAAGVGRRAIGVLLTGASDDGAQGVVAIKRAGGRVIVQSPESAESAVAPNAALARITPDAVLDLDDIPALLCSWTSRSG